jgi:hypothetical protein
MKYKIWTFALVFLFALSGCGGSGEDWASQDPSASAVSTRSFNIQEGWTALHNSPHSSLLKVSGSCEGTYILSNSAALQSGNVMFNTVTVNLAYGNLAPCLSPYENMASVDKSDSTTYYATIEKQYKNYYAMNANYVYAWRAVAAFPTSVKVGSAGMVGIIDKKYANAKIAVEEWTYVIEKDTANSAIFNLVVKTYDTKTSITNSDYLTAPIVKTEQFRYLINEKNQIALVKYDRVDANGFLIHGSI